MFNNKYSCSVSMCRIRENMTSGQCNVSINVKNQRFGDSFEFAASQVYSRVNFTAFCLQLENVFCVICNICAIVFTVQRPLSSVDERSREPSVLGAGEGARHINYCTSRSTSSTSSSHSRVEGGHHRCCQLLNTLVDRTLSGLCKMGAGRRYRNTLSTM